MPTSTFMVVRGNHVFPKTCSQMTPPTPASILPVSLLPWAGIHFFRLDKQLNKTIQNLVFTMLKDDSEIAAKKSLDIMVVLYRKRVWVVREAKKYI